MAQKIKISAIPVVRTLPKAGDYSEIGNGDLGQSAKELCANRVYKAATLLALKALPVAQAVSGQTVVMNSVVAGDGNGASFYYDPLSTLTPDDDKVVKPNEVTLPASGRWIRSTPNQLDIFRMSMIFS